MNCDKCGNNPIKDKPNRSQLPSAMIPINSWIKPLKWVFFTNLVLSVIFFVLIEPKTGLNIYYGFVPLFIALLTHNLLANVLLFSGQPFLCKLCGHKQNLREVQKLSKSCRKCKGHDFIKLWKYPTWTKFISIIEIVSLIFATVFAFFAIAKMSQVFFAISAVAGMLWLICFVVLESRSNIFNNILMKGSDMILSVNCANCGSRQ